MPESVRGLPKIYIMIEVFHPECNGHRTENRAEETLDVTLVKALTLGARHPLGEK